MWSDEGNDDVDDVRIWGTATPSATNISTNERLLSTLASDYSMILGFVERVSLAPLTQGMGDAREIDYRVEL
jgi:hypothetical protein